MPIISQSFIRFIRFTFWLVGLNLIYTRFIYWGSVHTQNTNTWSWCPLSFRQDWTIQPIRFKLISPKFLTSMGHSEPTLIQVIHPDSSVYTTKQLMSSWIYCHTIHRLANLGKQKYGHVINIYQNSQFGVNILPFKTCQNFGNSI